MPPKRMSVDDVIAAVDVERFPGDELCRIRREKGHCNADIVNGDEATRWCLRLGFL